GVVVAVQLCVFFFSSRRRHTRSKRDWSSDVCSSDLTRALNQRKQFSSFVILSGAAKRRSRRTSNFFGKKSPAKPEQSSNLEVLRSEERRVGKECRCRL